MSLRRLGALLGVVLIALGNLGGSCGGGGGGSSGDPGGGGGGAGSTASQTCSADCAQVALSAPEVETVIAQAVAQAQALGVAANIAVLDHVGNVLAVFRMDGAPNDITITTNRGVDTGLDGLSLDRPTEMLIEGALGISIEPTAPFNNSALLAAISKGGTAAYLSTQGNAFSTRTANHIIQENFSPGETERAGGPLFGVQFSQLPCSDFSNRFGVNALEGPKRMPLGFAADPGGIPLYVDGVPVGGIGVEVNGIYTLDPNIMDIDVAIEERIASAGAAGFEAPENRRADRIAVDGRFLRFADDENFSQVAVPSFADLNGSAGDLVDVAGFYDAAGGVQAGVLFQDPASGIVATSFEGIPAEILTLGAGGTPRFPPIPSDDPLPPVGLSADEVRVILREALAVAERSRAQIRRPGGSKAKVSLTVVDRSGNVLGLVRGRDAPIFGIEVAVQKARTAAFYSGTDAGTRLQDPGAQYSTGPFQPVTDLLSINDPAFYVGSVRSFLGDPTALANGIAFSDRAGGNLSRPFYPDGVNGNANGPFSRPFASWSPFSTGLQLDLVIGGILQFLVDANGDAPASCTAPSLFGIRNGIQIFPGSVPIYRDDVLIGGIGISGDGVDQDDLIAFLGLHNAGQILGTGVGNAPPAIRADRIRAGGVNLRFISCPFSPFLNSDAQNVCEGL